MIYIALGLAAGFGTALAFALSQLHEARHASGRWHRVAVWERGLRQQAEDRADAAALRAQELLHRNAQLDQANQELSEAVLKNAKEVAL